MDLYRHEGPDPDSIRFRRIVQVTDSYLVVRFLKQLSDTGLQPGGIRHEQWAVHHASTQLVVPTSSTSAHLELQIARGGWRSAASFVIDGAANWPGVPRWLLGDIDWPALSVAVRRMCGQGGAGTMPPLIECMQALAQQLRIHVQRKLSHLWLPYVVAMPDENGDWTINFPYDVHGEYPDTMALLHRALQSAAEELLSGTQPAFGYRVSAAFAPRDVTESLARKGAIAAADPSYPLPSP